MCMYVCMYVWKWKKSGKCVLPVVCYRNLLEDQCCQISSRSNLKRWSLRLFWRVSPLTRTRWVVMSDRLLIKNSFSNDWFIIQVQRVHTRARSVKIRFLLPDWCMVFDVVEYFVVKCGESFSWMCVYVNVCCPARRDGASEIGKAERWRWQSGVHFSLWHGHRETRFISHCCFVCFIVHTVWWLELLLLLW